MSANEQSGADLRAALQRVAGKGSLSRAESRGVMTVILRGEATPAQVGALLLGIALRGPAPEEVAGFAEAMREAATRIEPAFPGALDLCGTGGDSSGTINISTAASLISAGCGVQVAKHGNRSITSRAGSADVLEALGVPIDLPPPRTRAAIEEHGFGFLFAPLYHPAMRNVAGIRKELGIRTVFNILGPLTNPAGVRRQLLGVYEDGLRPLVARVLLELGSERVWVVHSPLPGGGGIDEIGLHGPTRVSAIEDGALRELEISPEDAGLPRRPLSDLKGGDVSENARRLLAVLSGERGPDRDAAVLNAAAALRLAGISEDLKECARRAGEVLDRGRGMEVLEAMRRHR